MTGVTGLKPTYGRVSRYGMVAFASSLDQGGTLTTTAEDAALLLGIIAGFDPRDSTSAEAPVPSYLSHINDSLEGLTVGVPVEFMDERLDAGIAQVIRDALSVYAAAGAEIRDISLPNVGLAVATYYVVACAEASSNLSRFDGVRFGHRCENPKDLTDLYKRTRGEGFGTEVKRRIMTGTYVLSAGYFDAYYLQAQKVRQLISGDFSRAFEEVDVIMGPTTPTPAFELGAQLDDPVTMYLNDIYTTAVNLAGLPGMSIPCGMTQGLPVGLQIIGAPFAEAKLLNVAHVFQQGSDWHRGFPDE
jgi:aspartyl-tRNA(Asn)/glutamyl-tRNA(Gln) amidotransferase subunit A